VAVSGRGLARRAGAALVLATCLCAVGAPAQERAGAPAQDWIGLPLKAVRFECDAWIDQAGLRALLPLTQGAPVTELQIAESRRILELAKVFRAIDVETRAEDGGAVVTFLLQRKRIVTDVSVRGYDELKWRDVYRLLRLRTGSFYDPEVVEAARQRLLSRYRQIGYPRAEVTSAQDEQRGEVDLRFIIDEGRAVIVAAAVVTGETGLPAAELEEALKKFVGKPIRREAPRQGERLLQERLREAGYFDAQIDGEWIKTDDDHGALWFTVEAGERTEVEFIGNESRSDEQLLGLMDLKTRLIITDGTWRELGRRIRRAYKEGGYYRVKVKLKIEDGDPRRVTYTIDQGRPYVVREVRFVGNEQIDDDQLRAEMNTKPGRLLPFPRSGAFVRSVFDDDLRRLWFFYREQGFADAEIVDAPVDVDDADGWIDVTVVIDEGPRTIVEEVRPPDLSELPPDRQHLAPGLVPGQPLLPATLEADTEAIRRALRSDGYTDATVEPVVTRRPAGPAVLAVVGWKIAPGPRRTIGQVVVQGNVETRNAVVLRELPFRSGDALDPEALRRGQDQVYQLGAYRSVAVQPLGPVAPVQDVGVDVVPRPPGSLQWGVGYNTRDGITAFGEVSYDNVGHSARRISLRGAGSVLPDDASQTQFLAILAYREPQFLGTPWQWTSEVIGERTTRTIDQFSVLRGSLGNGFARSLTGRLKGGAELQLERADTFDVKPTSFLDEDEGVSYTTALSPFLVYDGRNDRFAPTSGIFESARLRYAPPGVSTVQFGKLNIQHSQAFPLATWLSFIYSARVAYGRAFSGAKVLPIRERYFLGGSTTVRGYSENSLGPIDCTEDPMTGKCTTSNVIGGDLAMVLSFEWRVPIIYQLSAAAFTDNGALFLTQCDAQCRQNRGVRGNAFTFKNFRHSAGPGLRYMTPVGPISLDYGFKIDRRTGESIGEVHFSISGTF
jgi:outer membrane protein insertion porin family